MKRIIVALLILLAASPAMAMRSYTGWAQNDTGDRLYQAEIRVYLAGTEGATSAIIYSDDGITPMAQPILTDYHGKYRFYVADGTYDIKSSYGGSDTWLYDEQIVDNLGRDFSVTAPTYGAKGDGSTDDTAAIQAAIDACEAAGGGRIYFPPTDSYYKITSAITVSVQSASGHDIALVGASPLASRLILTSGSDNVIEVDGWTGSTAERAIIENLAISKGGGATGSNAILLKNCKQARLRNLRIYGFAAGAGIKIDTTEDGATAYLSTQNTIRDSYIAGCLNGIHIDCASTVASSYNTANVISGCQIGANTNYEVLVENTGGAGSVDGQFISDCWMQCGSSGSHGLNLDDGTSACKVANTAFDGSASTTCITISATSTYNQFANVSIDGTVSDGGTGTQVVNSHLSGGGSWGGSGGSGSFWFNASNYGAVGDGATDSAPAIQAAIDAAEAAGGGTVFIPAGYYRVASALTIEASSVVLRGAGMGQYGSTGYGTVISASGAVAPMLTIGQTGGNVYGSGVQDIHLYTTNYSANGLLKFLNSVECFAKNCRLDMRNTDDDGRATVTFDTSTGYYCTRNLMSDCVIRSPYTKTGAVASYGYGILQSNSGYTDGYPEYVTLNAFTNCRLENSATDLGGYLFATEDNAVGRSIVTGCYFEVDNGDQGINLAGAYGGDTFTNCTVIGDGSEVLTFASGAENCFFQGVLIGGTWSDANSNDDLAVVLDSGADSKTNMGALRLIPRATAPAAPVTGDIYWDSDVDSLYMYIGSYWQGFAGP